MEVTHTDLTEVTRVVLVPPDAMVVLATGVTTTTGMLTVLTCGKKDDVRYDKTGCVKRRKTLISAGEEFANATIRNRWTELKILDGHTNTTVAVTDVTAKLAGLLVLPLVGTGSVRSVWTPFR